MEEKVKKTVRPPTAYSSEFKAAAVRRMEAGEGASELARELGILRKLLYYWRSQIRQGKPLNARGRPRKEVVAANSEADRIAELERLVGRQQLEVSFFRGALRRLGALNQPKNGTGAMSSLPKSGE